MHIVHVYTMYCNVSPTYAVAIGDRVIICGREIDWTRLEID